jgi:hypothetical protein
MAVSKKRPAVPGIGWDFPMPGTFRRLVPRWLMALVVGLPITNIRIRGPWQFQLRSLFITMTLLTVLLAMIVRLK